MPAHGDWRPSIIRQSALFMGGAGVFFLIGMAFSSLPFWSPTNVSVMLWLPLIAFTVLAPKRVGDDLRAFIVVASLAGTSAIAAWQLGPVMNAGIGLVMSVLLTGVLFGRRAATALLGFHTILLIALGVLFERHLIATPSAANVDPALFRNWLRVAVVFFFVCGGVVYAILGLVGFLQRARDQAQRSLAELQREQDARQRLEREQAEARRAMAQSQHLESIGRFAGGVAHDFNNALTVIMGAASELRTAEHAPTRELAQEILAAAGSAGALTKQLLAVGLRDVSRPEPTDIDQALRALEKPMRRVLHDDVTFTVETASGGVCLIDPTHLQQIVLNLVLNARDAMPRAGTLAIATRMASIDGRPAVAITVRDTGVGLEPEVLARIFEPFFTTKEIGRGTGLGLASVYGMVQRAEGRIAVQSAPGVGTTFEVLLPLTTQPAVAATPRISEPVAVVPATRPILVAEDQLDVRFAMCRALKHAGFVTIEARDADDALQQLRERGSELLMFCTDAVMPGVPMVEVLAEVRQKLPSLPVLLCSGYVEEDLLRRDIAAGNGAFLAKPFTSSALVKAVKELLGRAAPAT
ncbi:MAG: ATP-binding protein [Myxococcota bacterium]